MSELGRNLDPELLQARWVLGGIEPEQFVEIGVSALKQGFDGTALQQIAGLSQPTSRDLGNLPARVFAEMGLKPINQDEAVDLLLARGEPSTSPVISELRKAFPYFGDRWKEHIAWWGGNPAGSYNDRLNLFISSSRTYTRKEISMRHAASSSLLKSFW
jgi:hypothetical protein